MCGVCVYRRFRWIHKDLVSLGDARKDVCVPTFVRVMFLAEIMVETFDIIGRQTGITKDRVEVHIQGWVTRLRATRMECLWR